MRVRERKGGPLEAAKSLGVDRANVDFWVKKYSAELAAAGVAPTGEGALKAEIQRLRKENARLLMEREILKKAAEGRASPVPAYFAKEQP